MFRPHSEPASFDDEVGTADFARLSCPAKARLGFTLFELLVVLFLVGLLVGTFAFSYRQPSAGAQLKTSAEMAASRLRDLRVAAMSTGISQVAVIDTARREILSDNRQTVLKLSRGMNVNVTGAESEQRSSSAVGIRFFPNGSSSGGTITLAMDGQGYEVRVNWLTGRVSTSSRP